MDNEINMPDEFMDDASWAGLFEMADSYVEPDAAFGDVMQDPGENFQEQEKKYQTPEDALKGLFGYDSFRAGQKAVIDSILAGKDVLAVMPTGAGKSLCYQIPAMLLPGITLVISPLISLMQDQVKALNEAGVSAAFINSSLSESAFAETVWKAKRGYYKIIYYSVR